MRATTRRGLHSVVADVMSIANVIQEEIAEDQTTEWVATHGPIVTNTQNGMIYVHRAWHSLLFAVKAGASPARVSRLMHELAAAAVKIGYDLEVIADMTADDMFGPSAEGTDDD